MSWLEMSAAWSRARRRRVARFIPTINEILMFVISLGIGIAFNWLAFFTANL